MLGFLGSPNIWAGLPPAHDLGQPVSQTSWPLGGPGLSWLGPQTFLVGMLKCRPPGYLVFCSCLSMSTAATSDARPRALQSQGLSSGQELGAAGLQSSLQHGLQSTSEHCTGHRALPARLTCLAASLGGRCRVVKDGKKAAFSSVSPLRLQGAQHSQIQVPKLHLSPHFTPSHSPPPLPPSRPASAPSVVMLRGSREDAGHPEFCILALTYLLCDPTQVT